MPSTTDHEFRDRNEWRGWLKHHHKTQNEIWVIISKKNSGMEGLKYEEAVEEAVCFGWIDGKMQSIDIDRFRQRFSPRKRRSIWSKSNKERVERMIKAGKMESGGFETIEVAKRNGKWEAAYSSSMASKIPEDLEKALKNKESAWKNFMRLSNSTKFQYIYWIGSAKKEETRRKRIATLVTQSIAFKPNVRDEEPNSR